MLNKIFDDRWLSVSGRCTIIQIQACILRGANRATAPSIGNPKEKGLKFHFKWSSDFQIFPMSRHQHSTYNLSYRNWSNDSKILNLSFCMTKFYFCRPGRPITYWSFRHGCYGYGGMARITIFHCFPYHLHFSYSFHCLYFSIWQVSSSIIFSFIRPQI